MSNDSFAPCTPLSLRDISPNRGITSRGSLEFTAIYSAYISVPKEVAENTDAPLRINFNLVNAKGRGEVVTYSIR